MTWQLIVLYITPWVYFKLPLDITLKFLTNRRSLLSFVLASFIIVSAVSMVSEKIQLSRSVIMVIGDRNCLRILKKRGSLELQIPEQAT